MAAVAKVSQNSGPWKGFCHQFPNPHSKWDGWGDISFILNSLFQTLNSCNIRQYWNVSVLLGGVWLRNSNLHHSESAASISIATHPHCPSFLLDSSSFPTPTSTQKIGSSPEPAGRYGNRNEVTWSYRRIKVQLGKHRGSV